MLKCSKLATLVALYDGVSLAYIATFVEGVKGYQTNDGHWKALTY